MLLPLCVVTFYPYQLLEAGTEQLLNYWKRIWADYSEKQHCMFHELNKLTMVESNCSAARETTMHSHAFVSNLWY
jgi:hypothetical protein